MAGLIFISPYLKGGKQKATLSNRTHYIAIGFAKTIKMTGRIPTVLEVGSTRFQDFIKYARENWNV